MVHEPARQTEIHGEFDVVARSGGPAGMRRLPANDFDGAVLPLQQARRGRAWKAQDSRTSFCYFRGLSRRTDSPSPRAENQPTACVPVPESPPLA